VANNATANAAFRRIANAVRGIPEQLGARNTSVIVRVRTYSGAVGAQGTTLTSTADTVLTPIPKVTQVIEGTPSYFGGGIFTDSTGRVLAGEYEVGPITQEFPGGGYAPTDLAPAGSVSKRVTIVLTGDEFQAGGEEFEVIKVDATRPFRTMLLVTRVRRGA
jgi:hypothetical protein